MRASRARRSRWAQVACAIDYHGASADFDGVEQIDRFDRVQLADVIAVCQSARNLSDAGRQLFHASRERKVSSNDADRLRKYLARFALSFEQVRAGG